jgi:5-methyltetrahydrofolate--homocysteine methyltransferase
MSNRLVQAMADMMEQEALSIAREMLENGTDPLKILEQSREAMEIVGKRFAEGKYFLPELIMAGEMLSQISGMTKSKLSETRVATEGRLGTVVIGTVKGDIHDIGKDIVGFMMDAHGFEVIDMGVDVPPTRFVEAVREHRPVALGLSGLLTLAYDPMKETVEALTEAGMRDDVKIMIGGGAIDEGIREYTDADAYGADAVAAVTLARKWLGEG